MKSNNFSTKFSKRTKLIISFSAVLLILFTGYLSISAKTGFFSTLADEVIQATTGKITVTISIVGSDNKPMLDGSVEAYNKDGMLYEIGKPDNKGQVRFLLSLADYSFSFVSPNCGATTGVVSVNSNSKNFTIKSQCKRGDESGAIKQKITIEGKITDSSSRDNIKDAKVEVKSQDGKIIKNTLSTNKVATVFSHNYSIADMQVGSYTVTVTHNDYESQTKNISAGWFREVGDNTWLSAEVSFQLKKKLSAPPPTVTPPSGNYNLPGDALTNQTTFTLYLSLKDEQNKWISHSEKIGASITHSADNTIKKSGQLSPVQNWPNKNIAYQGTNMQANLTVLEIPISTKTGNYQIALNKLGGSNTDFNMPDAPITFTKNDIKTLTQTNGSKYAYFFYRYSLTKTETFDVIGTVKEEGTENLILNVELKLTCDGKEVGTVKSRDKLNSNKANYEFLRIPKTYVKCQIDTISYESEKYLKPESSIFETSQAAFIHNTNRFTINKNLEIKKIENYRIIGKVIKSTTIGVPNANIILLKNGVEIQKTTTAGSMSAHEIQDDIYAFNYHFEIPKDTHSNDQFEIILDPANNEYSPIDNNNSRKIIMQEIISNRVKINDDNYFAVIEDIIVERELLKVLIKDKESNLPIYPAKLEILEPGLGLNIVKEADKYGVIKIFEEDREVLNSLMVDGYGERQEITSALLKISGDTDKYSSYAETAMFIINDIVLAPYQKNIKTKEYELSAKTEFYSRSICGIVYSEPDYVGGAKVSLFKNGIVSGAMQTTNPNGEFCFKNVDQGQYMLRAYHKDYYDFKGNYFQFTVDGGGRINIKLFLNPIGEYFNDISFYKDLTGIEDYSGGDIFIGKITFINRNIPKPIPGVHVKLFSNDVLLAEDESNREGALRFVTNGVGGADSYSIEVKYAGSSENFDLKAQKKSKLFIVEDILFLDNAKTDQNTIKNPKIKFVVIDQNNKRFKNVSVRIDYSDYISFSAKTNSNGEVNFINSFSRQIKNLEDPKLREKIKSVENEFLFADEDIKANFIFSDGAVVEYIFNPMQDQGETIEINRESSDSGKYVEYDFLDKYGESVFPLPDVELFSSKSVNGKYSPAQTYENTIKGYGRIQIIDDKLFYKIMFSYTDDDGNLREIWSAPSKFKNYNNVLKIIGQDCEDGSYIKNVTGEATLIIEKEFLEFFSKETINDISSGLIRLRKLNFRNASPLVLSVTDGELFNAFASGERINNVCFGGGKSETEVSYIGVGAGLIKWLVAHNRMDMLENIIAHEYGHIIDLQIYNKDELNELYKDLISDLDTFSDINNAIKDGFVGLYPGALGGHIEDGSSELFASFYSAYFTNHDRLYGIIEYETIADSPAQNILKYMWQYFAENIGKVRPDDDKIFLPVGGKISNIDYSYSQITRGDWLFKNYQKLALSQKISVQYSRMVKSTLQKYSSEKIAEKFNDLRIWLDKKFNQYVKNKDVGTISGRVYDRSRKPLSGAIIQIGPRIGVTNKSGYFVLFNVPVGLNEVIYIEKDKEIYGLSGRSIKNIEVVKNQKTSVKIYTE